MNHAGNMFEKMEKKENEFERRVSTTMNSDAFQTLKQIYDANMFVQKATHEDDEIVSDYVFSNCFLTFGQFWADFERPGLGGIDAKFCK